MQQLSEPGGDIRAGRAFFGGGGRDGLFGPVAVASAGAVASVPAVAAVGDWLCRASRLRRCRFSLRSLRGGEDGLLLLLVVVVGVGGRSTLTRPAGALAAPAAGEPMVGGLFFVTRVFFSNIRKVGSV